MPWITPQRLTPSVHAQSASVSVHIGPALPPTPALLQTTCAAPKCSTVRAASAATAAPSCTSVRTASTLARPAPGGRQASTAPSGPSSTSASTTFIPSAAKRSARALPMPLAAPVTTATLPPRSFTVRAHSNR